MLMHIVYEAQLVQVERIQGARCKSASGARMWREGATASITQGPERVKEVRVGCTLGWAKYFREGL